jgi:hypothetical protein
MFWKIGITVGPAGSRGRLENINSFRYDINFNPGTLSPNEWGEKPYLLTNRHR